MNAGFASDSAALSVLIADDHLLMAQAMAKLLEGQFGVIAALNSGADFLDAAAITRPDLALIDVCMPGLTGMEVTRRLRHIVPSCKVILLSMYSNPEFVREGLSAGASGYLLKSCAAAELCQAIHEVMDGKVYVGSHISKDALASLLLSQNSPELSPRQREVLALVAEGCSAKEVAGRLSIKVKTAQFHKASIMAKLGVHTTAELTKYALGHGIASY